MKAIVNTLEKKSGEIFENVVNEVINVVYTNDVFILLTSDGQSISYSNSNKDWTITISVV